jgi:hypothetical protein
MEKPQSGFRQERRTICRAAQGCSVRKPVEQTKEPQTQPQAKPIDAKPADAKPAAAKQKKNRPSTEARVIYELHRHGIYW